MRYSYSINHITKSNQTSACRYANSYLFEHLQDRPYDYRNDPVLSNFINRSLYFKLGSSLDILARIEEKIVVDYIPVLLNVQDFDTSQDDPEVIAQARTEAQVLFALIDTKYPAAKQELLNKWCNDLQAKKLYLKKLFEEPPGLGYWYVDRLKIQTATLTQLYIESRQYRVLNRYLVLRKVEEKYNLQSPIHQTKRHGFPNRSCCSFRYSIIKDKDQIRALRNPGNYFGHPQDFPHTDWPDTERPHNWDYFEPELYRTKPSAHCIVDPSETDKGIDLIDFVPKGRRRTINPRTLDPVIVPCELQPVPEVQGLGFEECEEDTTNTFYQGHDLSYYEEF